jgi:hypothetical protein
MLEVLLYVHHFSHWRCVQEDHDKACLERAQLDREKDDLKEKNILIRQSLLIMRIRFLQTFNSNKNKDGVLNP